MQRQESKPQRHVRQRNESKAQRQVSKSQREVSKPQRQQYTKN